MISMQTAPQGRTPTFEQVAIEFWSVVVNIVRRHVQWACQWALQWRHTVKPTVPFNKHTSSRCGVWALWRNTFGKWKKKRWVVEWACGEKPVGVCSGRVKSIYMSVSAARFVATTSLGSGHSVFACSRPAEPHIGHSQFLVSPACPAPYIRSDHDCLLLLPIGLTSQNVRKAQSVSGE